MADEKACVHYLAVAQVTERATDGAEYLLVVITITCPVCGVVKMELPGHHVRPLRNILIGMVDDYPALTSKAHETQVLEALERALSSEGVKH